MENRNRNRGNDKDRNLSNPGSRREGGQGSFENMGDVGDSRGRHNIGGQGGGQGQAGLQNKGNVGKTGLRQNQGGAGGGGGTPGRDISR
jgi:hypothetical protein